MSLGSRKSFALMLESARYQESLRFLSVTRSATWQHATTFMRVSSTLSTLAFLSAHPTKRGGKNEKLSLDRAHSPSIFWDLSVKQYVRLSFMGVDPDEVTKRLDIKPTSARKAGAERTLGATWRHDYWELTADVSEGEVVAEKHFEALFKTLQSRFDAIRMLGAPTISWIVYVSRDEATPDGVISNETLRKIHALGACLNVDMYFDAGEKCSAT
jgi:hypothetical protein